MNRRVASIPAGLLLWCCATASVALVPDLVDLGAVDPGFNGGQPWNFGVFKVGGTYANLVTYGQGPRTDGLRATFGYTAGSGASAQTGIFMIEMSKKDPGRFVSPLQANDFDSTHLLGRTPPVSLGGIQVAGNLTVVTGNERRPDGNFDAYLYAFERTSSQPLALKTTLKLTSPSAVSEEVVKTQFRRRPSTIDGQSSQLYVLTAGKTSTGGDCRVPAIYRVDGVTDPVAPFKMDIRYESRALGNFPECHETFVGLQQAWGPFKLPTEEVVEPESLYLGFGCKANASAPAKQVCLYKLRDDMNAFLLDTSFGGDGQVIIRHAGVGEIQYFDHAVDRGKVVVGVGVKDAPGGAAKANLVRLNPDGLIDTSFGSGGVLSIPTTGLNTNLRKLTVDINGSYQVSGETYFANGVKPWMYFHTKVSLPGSAEAYASKLVEYNFPGKENSVFLNHDRNPDGTITAVGATFGTYPNVTTMQPLVVQLKGPPAAIPAREYFHSDFGTYVTIANPDEADKLDSGGIKGWIATGNYFYVYPLGTPDTFGVDRFFSRGFPSNGILKSTHFIAANAAESAAVKQNPDWTLEGTVFGAVAPTAEGKCPPNLLGIGRWYNGGEGGVPNHRLFDNKDFITSPAALGGVVEGLGRRGIVYCSE